MSSAIRWNGWGGIIFGISIVIALLFCIPRLTISYNLGRMDGFWADWLFRLAGSFLVAFILLILSVQQGSARRIILSNVLVAFCFYVVLLVIHQNYFQGRLPLKLSRYIFTISFVLEVILVWVIAKLIRLSIKKQLLHNQHQELRQLHNEIALNQLKNQLQPHFFFNTLTTLKGLIQFKPDQALGFVHEMADFFRVMLDMNNRKTISLGEEIHFVNSYVNLLRARFPASFYFEVRIPQTILSVSIPAISVQLLIENAFKHTSFSERDPLTIEIFWQAPFLVVQNNYNPVNTLFLGTRVGLENLNSRFQLFFNKEIQWGCTDRHFQVYLPLISTNESSNH